MIALNIGSCTVFAATPAESHLTSRAAVSAMLALTLHFQHMDAPLAVNNNAFPKSLLVGKGTNCVG